MTTITKSAFVLVKTRLRGALDKNDVSDVREEVANAITSSNSPFRSRLGNGELGRPEIASVLLGPIQIIIPLYAQDEVELNDLICAFQLQRGEGPLALIKAHETLPLYVTDVYERGSRTGEVVPRRVVYQSSQDRQLNAIVDTYLFIKTEPGMAGDVASAATASDLVIANSTKTGTDGSLNSNPSMHGIRWAAVLEENSLGFHVLAGIRADDHFELARAQAAIRRIAGVANPDGKGVSSDHTDAQPNARTGPP